MATIDYKDYPISMQNNNYKLLPSVREEYLSILFTKLHSHVINKVRVKSHNRAESGYKDNVKR